MNSAEPAAGNRGEGLGGSLSPEKTRKWEGETCRKGVASSGVNIFFSLHSCQSLPYLHRLLCVVISPVFS